MGSVHRATDRATGRRAALKLLASHRDVDRARFAREATVLANLAHEGIVSYLAHGRAPDDTPYLAMEWIDGEDLASRLARGALDVGDTLALAHALARALVEAHARGVVHRDLKPSNVLLAGGHAASPKLADFGVARMLGPATRLTRTGHIVGTPSYMAPEQIRADADVDDRADVFAFGVLLHHCVTGTAPFEGPDVRVVFAKITYGPTPSIGERDGLPPEFAALLVGMMAKDPSERPSCAIVEEVLAHLAVTKPPPR